MQNKLSCKMFHLDIEYREIMIGEANDFRMVLADFISFLTIYRIFRTNSWFC